MLVVYKSLLRLRVWSRRFISHKKDPQATDTPDANDSAIFHIPANTRRWPNVGLMLGQRRRRWANISPTLGQCIVFAGIAHIVYRVPETLSPAT